MKMQTDNTHKDGSVEFQCRNCTQYDNCEEKLGEKFNPYSWCPNHNYDM